MAIERNSRPAGRLFFLSMLYTKDANVLDVQFKANGFIAQET
jgi:hypothetical protein